MRMIGCSRRSSVVRAGPRGGIRLASSCTAIEMRLSTRIRPLRSRMSPRGAGTTMSRTWLFDASARYLSPESTWRYHSRKNTIANMASAIPASMATRSASCGVMGGRRSSWSWSTASGPLLRPRDRGQAAGDVGAATATARILGQHAQQEAAHEGVDGHGQDGVDGDGDEYVAQEQQAHRRVHPEEELDDREPQRSHGRGGRA